MLPQHYVLKNPNKINLQDSIFSPWLSKYTCTFWKRRLSNTTKKHAHFQKLLSQVLSQRNNRSEFHLWHFVPGAPLWLSMYKLHGIILHQLEHLTRLQDKPIVNCPVHWKQALGRGHIWVVNWGERALLSPLNLHALYFYFAAEFAHPDIYIT